MNIFPAKILKLFRIGSTKIEKQISLVQNEYVTNIKANGLSRYFLREREWVNKTKGTRKEKANGRVKN